MDVNCIVSRTIRLAEPTKKITLHEPLAYNNQFAHAMQVAVVDDDKQPVELTGVSVVGTFLNNDGVTVDPIVGTVDGNVASVLLPPGCYVCPGWYRFTMNLVSGDASRTVLWVEGMVERNVSGNISDPGTPVGNIEQAVGNANNAATAANQAAAAAQEVVDGVEGEIGDIKSVNTIYNRDVVGVVNPIERATWLDNVKYNDNGTAYVSQEGWKLSSNIQTSGDAYKISYKWNSNYIVQVVGYDSSDQFMHFYANANTGTPNGSVKSFVVDTSDVDHIKIATCDENVIVSVFPYGDTIADDVDSLKKYSYRFEGAPDSTTEYDGVTVSNDGRKYSFSGSAASTGNIFISILDGTSAYSSSDWSNVNVIHLKKGHTYQLSLMMNKWPQANNNEVVEGMTVDMFKESSGATLMFAKPGRGSNGDLYGFYGQYYCTEDIDIRLRLFLAKSKTIDGETVYLNYNGVNCVVGFADVTSCETIGTMLARLGTKTPINRAEFNYLTVLRDMYLGSRYLSAQEVGDFLYGPLVLGQLSLRAANDTASLSITQLNDLLALPKIQYGIGLSNTNGILEITFNTPFSAEPVVLLTPSSGTNSGVINAARLTSVSTTGFKCVTLKTTGQSITPDTNRLINWLALGT